MTVSLTTIARRLLALGILVGLLFSVWLLAIGPLLDLQAAEVEAQRRSVKLLAAYRERIAERPALESRLQALRLQEASMPGLVNGATAALAAAQLQADVRQILAAQGGEIRSTQVLPTSLDRNLERIPIRIEVSVKPAALQAVLYQLEIHTPFLFTDSLTIFAPDNGKASSRGGQQPPLSLRWDFHAYRWAKPS